jgi:hypothetical protein
MKMIIKWFSLPLGADGHILAYVCVRSGAQSGNNRNWKIKNSARIQSPLTGVKASFKVGLKGDMTHTSL